MNAIGASVWGRLLTWLDHPSPEDNYWRLRRMPHSRDETARLQELLGASKFDPARTDAAFKSVAHRLRASRILFVPAVLSGIALKASRLRLVEYLTHQVRQLRDEGFEADIAEIDTGARVEPNAERLAGIIATHHRPTWVVTHSKGGLDFLHTLVSHPELVRFVDGWISFQAPFMGSPIADVALGSPRARKISGAALKLLGADLAAIDDLRTDRRAHYMDEHQARIARIAEEVAIMCVGTVSGSSVLKPSLTPDWPTGKWMDGLGLKNDGLVPVNSAVLPGARHVLLESLGHGQVATRHILSNRKFEHIDLLKALFAITLNTQAASAREAAA
ncbi:MAG: hypothetical protein K8S25_16635 [Alphaproteobacteria bacterium]|nr:hypothetical protein [Alphaproteobacteria bacterium]